MAIHDASHTKTAPGIYRRAPFRSGPGASTQHASRGVQRTESERLRDELRLLRNAARAALEVFESIDLDDAQAERVVRVLRDRAVPLLSGSEVAR
jgi:carboxylesterase type B